MQGLENLLRASLSPSSVQTYRRACQTFNSFCESNLGEVLDQPYPVGVIALFVSHLHNKGFSAKSIQTYLSAIGYVHKVMGFHDPTSDFLITRLVRGAQCLMPSYDLRLPITVPILNKITRALAHVASNIYHFRLIQAMFLFAFSSLARCGEIALSGKNKEKQLVQLEDVHIVFQNASPSKVEITFRYFKYNYGKPHTLSFSHGNTIISPVHALVTYLKIRGSQSGPLFLLASGVPVPRVIFDRYLKHCLIFCGFDPSRFKSHSFRIGKATELAQKGHSDAFIRLMGRWHSNAFHKYVRNYES